MAFDHQIEVAVPPDTNTTEIGNVLERLGARFLGTQNYRVEQQVRLTASEVDLLAVEKTTGERIYVECKAYRSTISANVITNLYGTVGLKNFSSGWLLSTFALGKDAKGAEDEWNQRPPEERRKLRIYPPDRLVPLLIGANLLVDPNTLLIDRSKFTLGTDAVLLLTPATEYWAIPVVDPGSGLRSGTLLFNASNGRRVTDAATLDQIAKTNTTVPQPYLTDSSESQRDAATRLQEGLQSIVRVPVADHWADYRPARPVDFIGRDRLQADVFDLLEAVARKTTRTRLIALKGPSGWGKSSSVLKIASKAENIRNRKKYFVFTVDSRAATTGRFPELAIAAAIKSAVTAGFLRDVGPVELGGATSIFSTRAMQSVACALEEQGRVLCVFFDQFEELLYKADLSEVFNQMRAIAAAVEEAQTNVVIGFSWKTDGVIPPEHSAYHLWHSLADRRLEISLDPFSKREVGKAINSFAGELGQPLLPQLRRLLEDHCQGFPWLLKKLCVHILDLARTGMEQTEILDQAVNIEALFKRDVESLSDPREFACLKQIAQDAPAEFFAITRDFGNDVVSRLIDKRLVIRSGPRLSIYWDIFRDYILTGRIPHIPVTYVPQATFPRYARALMFMTGKIQLTYAELASHMGCSPGAADNLVRDLANLGHVEANRKNGWVRPRFKTEQQALETAIAYWNAHEIVRSLREVAAERSLTIEDFNRVYQEASKREELGAETMAIYSSRILGWLRGLGILSQIGSTLIVSDSRQHYLASLIEITERRSIPDTFLGEAPPAKVIAAFRSLCSGSTTRAQIEAMHGRNTCYALMKLGLMHPDGRRLLDAAPEHAEGVVAMRVAAAPTISAAIELLRKTPDASVPGLEVGKYLATRFGASWSEGSERRYGTAVRQWAEWKLALDGPQR